MDYSTLKLLHQSTVAISICGFFARGLGGLLGAPWVRSRAARAWPHVIDTVLLLSALGLLWQLRPELSQAPWLAAKLSGLLVYIGLGIVALKPGRPIGLRVAAFVGALLTVSWMISVALSKHSLGFFAT